MSPNGQYWNQIDYIFCSQRWRSFIQSSKTRLGADCGSDNELLIAKFILKLKKVGKTTKPFRYDRNKILYDYTVEVMNRFKRLDLVECLKNYGQRFTALCRRQWPKSSQRKKCKKAKWLSEEALQIAEERREAKSKGERERHMQPNTKFQRLARRNKKAFSNEQWKELEENNRIGKTKHLFKKLEISKEYFIHGWAW